MVEEIPKLVRPCPPPEICPLGAKPAGHECRMGLELRTPRGTEFLCAFCEVHLRTMLAMLGLVPAGGAAAGPKIIIAQQAPPGALPGPGFGNNGRK